MSLCVSFSSKLRQPTQRTERKEQETAHETSEAVIRIPDSDSLAIRQYQFLFVQSPDHLIELPGTPPPGPV
jgi:hypothetical protein